MLQQSRQRSYSRVRSSTTTSPFLCLLRSGRFCVSVLVVGTCSWFVLANSRPRDSALFGDCHTPPSSTSASLLFPVALAVTTGKSLPLARRKIMTSAPSRDASALAELKETIRLQTDEIRSLREQLRKRSGGAGAGAGAHGHGASPSSSTMTEYCKAPFYRLASNRVGWLGLFLCSLSVTAVVLRRFESVLERHIELAFFVPLLAGHGGNTGGQTVGTVLTALSTGTIRVPHDVLRVVRREALSGLTIGLVLGVCLGVAALSCGISPRVSAAVACTLPVTSTVAALLACIVPFGSVALGLDPALVSAPAVTTTVDVIGLLSYFFVAGIVFRAFGAEL